MQSKQSNQSKHFHLRWPFVVIESVGKIANFQYVHLPYSASEDYIDYLRSNGTDQVSLTHGMFF